MGRSPSGPQVEPGRGGAPGGSREVPVSRRRRPGRSPPVHPTSRLGPPELRAGGPVVSIRRGRALPSRRGPRRSDPCARGGRSLLLRWRLRRVPAMGRTTMFNIGTQELLLILLAVLLLFGAKRIPEVARSLGKGLGDFRDALSGVERELKGEPPAPRREPPETAVARPRLSATAAAATVAGTAAREKRPPHGAGPSDAYPGGPESAGADPVGPRTAGADPVGPRTAGADPGGPGPAGAEGRERAAGPAAGEERRAAGGRPAGPEGETLDPHSRLRTPGRPRRRADLPVRRPGDGPGLAG